MHIGLVGNLSIVVNVVASLFCLAVPESYEQACIIRCSRFALSRQQSALKAVIDMSLSMTPLYWVQIACGTAGCANAAAKLLCR